MNVETLCQELTQSAQIIRALVMGISQADAQIKPDAESWSILEVICHLYDEERDDFRLRLDIVLHRPDEPFPPIHPSQWVTERRYNERDLLEMLEKFAAEREKSLDWLKGLSSPNWEVTYTHPYGSVRAGDLFCAWVAHDNLHIRQLVELRRARIVRLTAPFEVGYAGDW